VTGFVVESVGDAIDAVQCVPTLSRRRIRQVFEQRFTAARMARNYVRQYEQLLNCRAQPATAEVTP
jgi:hypothetical protein